MDTRRKLFNMDFQLLKTDFYQLSMAATYILTDQANEIAGFEAFYRKVNPKINQINDTYNTGIVDYKVDRLIQKIKKEIQDPNLLESFICLVRPKFPKDKADEYEKIIRHKWNTELCKDFVVSIYPFAATIKPYIPIFQYYGPIWIGQLLETPLLNTINGEVGLATQKYLNILSDKYDYDGLSSLVNGYSPSTDYSHNFIIGYKEALENRAKEYRESTTKVILEAGYRRASGYDTAKIASIKALEMGWNGTSNTSIIFDTLIPIEKIGGTMAHSFIMSQKDELTAYQIWNKIWPNSTFLIDTYDIKNALDMIYTNGLKPACIRIDSEPLDKWAKYARTYLDSVGWNDVKIFISGDLTPEKLKDFEKRNIPFDLCMAGTEYVNVGGSELLNAGFVYKLVEIHKSDGSILLPKKKSKNKGNEAGIKSMMYEKLTNTLTITRDRKSMGFFNMEPYDIVEKVKWEIKK